MKLRALLLLLFIIQLQVCYAQSDEAKAREIAKEAIRLMDEGQIDKSVTMLEEAIKLDPDNLVYPYEIGYAYYISEQYEKAIKELEPLTRKKKSYDQIYQLIGNAYDHLGQPDKAMKTYEKGLKKFPESGPLYLEKGIVLLGQEKYNEALDIFEAGIKAAPMHSSNYYWATKLWLSTESEYNGMIYGEIFLNLETGTQRTQEISQLLYDMYQSEITITSDTSFNVSFAKNTILLNMKDLKKMTKGKNDEKSIIPYGIEVYEMIMLKQCAGVSPDTINMANLHTIRQGFTENYYEEKYSERYPNVLFDFQKEIMEAGHMEAYNHWVLMSGNIDEFAAWREANEEKWDTFVAWFQQNDLTVTQENVYLSSNY